MQFFGHRRPGAAEPVMTGQMAGPPDHRDAFAEGIRRGRVEERARHRGHPVLMLLVLLVAVAGAAVIALAAREGSFSQGGQVVDRQLSVAADKAATAGRDAAAKIEQKTSDVVSGNK